LFHSYGKISFVDGQKPGWFFLRADDEISSYYKWFYSKGLKSWNSPMNGCHVTFLAGEKDDRVVSAEEMKSFIGQDIVFFYTNQVWTNSRAFWLPVLSPDLDQIRVEIGLQPKFLYHMTLGTWKIKNEN
jgi:hypothetical protein